MTLGNSSVSTLRCQVTSITALSDRRDKTDIVGIPIGLDFVNKLRPVKFKWATRDGNIKDGKISAGFIAQEVDTVLPNEVHGEDGEKGISPMGIIAHLVKTVQELEARVKELEGK